MAGICVPGRRLRMNSRVSPGQRHASGLRCESHRTLLGSAGHGLLRRMRVVLGGHAGQANNLPGPPAPERRQTEDVEEEGVATHSGSVETHTAAADDRTKRIFLASDPTL